MFLYLRIGIYQETTSLDKDYLSISIFSQFSLSSLAFLAISVKLKLPLCSTSDLSLYPRQFLPKKIANCPLKIPAIEFSSHIACWISLATSQALRNSGYSFTRSVMRISAFHLWKVGNFVAKIFVNSDFKPQCSYHSGVMNGSQSFLG